MGKVSFTYRSTRDIHTQPSMVEFESVVEALIGAYQTNRAKGYQAGIEMRKDGKEIYDEDALSQVIDRISQLVNIDGQSLEKSAEQIAKEDNHIT